MSLTLPYLPGSLPMPPFPPGYVPPVVMPRDPSVRPDGDVERLEGGDVYCETYQERDLIPAIYRREGISLAYVKQSSGLFPGDSFWYLRGGITNDCWVQHNGSSGGASGGTPTTLRIKPYGEWQALHAATPGGLRIALGEICQLLADDASAAAGLSNSPADTSTPRRQRMANAGEVLAYRIGEGNLTGWDDLPLYFAFPFINYPNGRILGTQQNGASHVYRHPVTAFAAIFGPVYSPPGVGVGITSNGADINGALYELGQVVQGVQVNVQPYVHSAPIRLGQALEGSIVLGADETAVPPASIGAFSRALPSFSLTPITAQYDAGSGVYRRSFSARVRDSRAAAAGGESDAYAGTVSVAATLPLFFGKSAATPPSDQAALGAWLQANLTQLLLGRQNYTPGNVRYTKGERPILAYPAAWGPLRDILDINGSSQLGYPGAAFNGPVNALLSKSGQYSAVPFLAYTTNGPGYNAVIYFSFLF